MNAVKKSMIVLAALLCLTARAQKWQPVAGKMMTRWSASVTPENVWQEYPRPQLRRESWLNLNGLWDYAVLDMRAKEPVKYQGKILVPFCIESSLSGVGKSFSPGERLWYRRAFTIPAGWSSKKILLHFEAVDWKTQVWVNGSLAGSHQGCYDAFSFDITPYVKPGKKQDIVVAVEDPTSTGSQPRGKQLLDPSGIWYTPVSGIWQTVWLEAVPKGNLHRGYPHHHRSGAFVGIGPALSASATPEHLQGPGNDQRRR